ncbi:MAG: site-specific DNA-methyltransferase [Terrisporobacter sp.]
MEKLDGKTFDVVSDNIKKLEELFPEIVTEGKVDVDKLALLFDKTRNEDNESNKDGEERYEFTWKGKKEAIRMSQKQTTGTLRPCKEESVNFDETQNLYIEGDNLEVLRALQSSYRDKVKMIYIDPPYNTGSDFVYRDDFTDNMKNYKKIMSESYKTNTDSSGRFHTNWINMMYPRLKLAKNLLSDDGAILISIDDNELNNLMKICEEIFGNKCFVGNICRATGTTTAQGTNSLGKSFDYLLMYSKTEKFDVGGIDLDEKDRARYNLEDERGRFSILQLRRTGGEDRREDRPSMYYGIETPDGTMIYPMGPTGYESRWRVGRETYEKMLANNEIYFKNDNGKWTVYYKFYLEGRTKRPSNIWNDIEGNKKAQIDLKALIPEKVFDTPKPIELLKRSIKISKANEESIILDFFSGSATTAHAVMQLNAEDGGNRKFIMVQLPEETDEKSEAYKNGYKNICEIGKERIRRAGKKIVEENKDKEGIEDLDIGFKVFKLDTTNIKEWDDTIQDTEEIKQMAMALENPIKDGRSQEDVIYEILLKYGVDLSMPIEEVQIMGSKVYSVGLGYLMICLEEDINLDLIEAIGDQKPNRVVLYDKGLDNESKTNGERILKELGVKDIRTI